MSKAVREQRTSLKETRRVILDMYEQFEPKVIAQMTGRSVGYIRCLASAMGIRSGGRGPSHAPTYSDSDLKLLRQSYGRIPIVHLARMLNRSEASVANAASRRLKLGRRRTRLWDPADDDVIRAKYPVLGAQQTSVLLGRSVNSVKHRARKLGVRRLTYEHPWRRDMFDQNP